MKSLDDMVRERRRERFEIQQRRQDRRRKLQRADTRQCRRRDHIVAVSIINGVFRDLGIAKALEQDRRVRDLARLERQRKKQEERDQRVAITIINGVMAMLGMPWPEIEAKAKRGWRVGGGLRGALERY